ncbi:MAG TPA: FAD binding domain-containing protein [Anaerolineaceae bacterium]
MALEYFRPQNLDEAIEVLIRSKGNAIPFIGGSGVAHLSPNADKVMIDLQDCHIDNIREEGEYLEIGTCIRLSQIAEYPKAPTALKGAILRDFPSNWRNQSSLGGLICAGGGHHTSLAVLLALDATINLEPGTIKVPIGEYLAQKSVYRGKKILTHVKLLTSVRISPVEAISRTPMSVPELFCVATSWKTGRVRMVFGGRHFALPYLAIDGHGYDAEEIANNAYSQYNQKSNYLQNCFNILTSRTLSHLAN